MSRKLWRMLMPAVLVSTSIAPRARTASANAASTCIRSVTSAMMASEIPGCCRRLASHASASRSRMQTCEPSSRNRAAVAAPIPLAPPVIRMRLSFRPRMQSLRTTVIYGSKIGAFQHKDRRAFLARADFDLAERVFDGLLDGLAAEEPDQFDNQNDHHHEFEHEGAALVELVNHEMIELLGGLQFLLHQILVVGHADLRCGQLVQAS